MLIGLRKEEYNWNQEKDKGKRAFSATAIVGDFFERYGRLARVRRRPSGGILTATDPLDSNRLNLVKLSVIFRRRGSAALPLCRVGRCCRNAQISNRDCASQAGFNSLQLSLRNLFKCNRVQFDDSLTFSLQHLPATVSYRRLA
jgi:hypothetical protein